jgi:hypothetical protein
MNEIVTINDYFAVLLVLEYTAVMMIEMVNVVLEVLNGCDLEMVIGERNWYGLDLLFEFLILDVEYMVHCVKNVQDVSNFL